MFLKPGEHHACPRRGYIQYFSNLLITNHQEDWCSRISFFLLWGIGRILRSQSGDAQGEEKDPFPIRTAASYTNSPAKSPLLLTIHLGKELLFNNVLPFRAILRHRKKKKKPVWQQVRLHAIKIIITQLSVAYRFSNSIILICVCVMDTCYLCFSCTT